MFSISERTAGDVTILDLSGPVTIGEGALHLYEKIRQLLNDGRFKILVNLADVREIDPAGLGVLIALYATTRNQRGALKLLNLLKRVESLIVIVKLITVFQHFFNEREALDSY